MIHDEKRLKMMIIVALQAHAHSLPCTCTKWNKQNAILAMGIVLLQDDPDADTRRPQGAGERKTWWERQIATGGTLRYPIARCQSGQWAAARDLNAG